MMKSKTTAAVHHQADLGTGLRRDSREGKRPRKPRGGSDNPSISEGVKKVFDCYDQVLRKLANE